MQEGFHEGDLGTTPMAHLLVYALDRLLTGALTLDHGAAAPTIVRFCRGVPVKVKPGDGFALLGEMLVEAGAVSPRTLAEALATKGLLGDVLLVAGRIESQALEAIAQEQFVRRMARLFELPASTRYRYEDGSAALSEWGGQDAGVDPLELLLRGVRAHGSLALAPTVAALAGRNLPLHASSPLGRF